MGADSLRMISICQEDGMIDLIGKTVVVSSVDGITYTGRLVEIGEEEVHIESEMGWVMIPVDRIASITEKKD